MQTIDLSSKVLSIERVVQVADKLPCAPRVLMELVGLLDDPNSGIPEITWLIRRDGAITARIIRIANGILYGRGNPVGSLEEALARVGYREVYRVTSTASMLQMAEIPLRFYPITPKALRENALLCALIMEDLAAEVGLDARVAYTVGLLRAVGRVVLDAAAQKDFRSVQVAPLGRDELVPWELATFGLTSGEAAAAVLKAWRFQAEVFVAVRDQFLHNLAVNALPMAKLLHIAVAGAADAGFGLAGGFAYVEKNAAQARTDLSLDDQRFKDAVERALGKFEQLKDILS